MTDKIVLIDSCGLTYYRVTATYSWCKKAHPDWLISPSNAEYIDALESQYLKHLSKIEKMTNTDSSAMILVRDCPIEQIWRRKHFPAYKQSRLNPKDSASIAFGPFIKHLNAVMYNKYQRVFRIDEAEADDVIAVLAKYYTDTSNSDVIIIGNDSDYVQLCNSRVSVLNPKTLCWVKSNPQILIDKIHKGDRCDGVPAAHSPLDIIRNSQLVDLDYVPRYIQDRALAHIPLSEIGKPSSYNPKNIQLGLCCIHTELRAKTIFCSRTMRLNTLEEKGLDELKSRARKNCQDLITMIKHITVNDGIRVLRISSDIFPHKSNSRALDYNLDFVDDLLKQAGKLARHYKLRMTFHPGHYNVVGTPDPDKFKNTCDDLDWQAEVLDIMGCDQDSVMVVHGGGMYGNKPATIQRWITQFRQLPERVQRRLVLENCEKCFNIEDCLVVSNATGVPVVFDTHHYDCYNILHPDEHLKPAAEYIDDILATWAKRSIKPKFHISEQRDGAKIGCHSDLIETIPDYLLNITTPFDIMVEAKLKEQAIFKLYRKYASLDPRTVTRKTLKLNIVKPKSGPRIRIKINIKTSLNVPTSPLSVT